MRKVYVFFHPAGRMWGADYLANGLVSALRKLGFAVRSLAVSETDNLAGLSFDRDDIVLGFGGACFKGVKGANDSLRKATIGLYNVNETLEGGVDNYGVWKTTLYDKMVLSLGRKVDFLLDYSPHAEKHHRKRLQVPTAFCPIGYDEAFDIHPGGPLVHDVVFLGREKREEGGHEYRNEALMFLRKNRIKIVKLNRKALSEEQVDDMAHLAWIKKHLRTVIWLHVNRIVGWCNFPDIRIVAYGFSNRLCVVSEPTSWAPPIVDGIHWFVRKLENIPHVCRRLLKNPAQAEEVGNNAYEFVTRYWRFEDHLKRALELVGQL